MRSCNGPWCVSASRRTALLEATLIAHLEDKRADPSQHQRVVDLHALATDDLVVTHAKSGGRCGLVHHTWTVCSWGEVCDIFTQQCLPSGQALCAPLDYSCVSTVPEAPSLMNAMLLRFVNERVWARRTVYDAGIPPKCVPSETRETTKKPKVLWWNNCDMHNKGQTKHNFPSPTDWGCSVPCELTDNLELLDQVDGVIIRLDYCMGNAGLNTREVQLGTGLPAQRPLGQSWMAYSSENPYNYPQMADPNWIRHFNYTSFQSLKSDLPIAYAAKIRLGDQGLDQIGIEGSSLVRPWTELAEPVPFEEKTGLASYIYSNCKTPSQRDNYTSTLMHYMKVDSFGRCIHNAEFPKDMQDGGMDDENREVNKDRAVNRYLFELTFQNALCDDEVDEKMLEAMRRGVVPVYMGAPNIRSLRFPRHSFIWVGDYSGPQELAEHLIRLSKSKAEYESYLTWRVGFKGIFPPFAEGLFNRPKAECWLCEQLHRAKKVSCAAPDLSCHTPPFSAA